MTTTKRIARQGPTRPYPLTPARPENATLGTKWRRLRRELLRWHKAGRPIASKATRASRRAICETCDYYAPRGNWGLGECKAPGCGCTRAKLLLATTRCPLSKWPSETLKKPPEAQT